MSALQSISTIVDQALFYSSTYWLHKNKNHLKHELTDFDNKAKEYERLLEIVVCGQDFAHQNNLETQIIDFKNLVDSSMSIRQYLLESKYVQLQSVTGSRDVVRDQYIEQKLAKKMSKAREQIHEITEKELSEKFEKDLKLAKKDNKKKVKARYKDDIQKLEEELNQKKAEIEGLNSKTGEKEAKIVRLEGQLVESDSKLAELRSKNDQLNILNQKLESDIRDIKAEVGNVNEENKTKDIMIEEL